MEDIIETLNGLGDTSTFISLIQLADMADTLNTEGPFTVFAPNNEAFSELPEETLDELRENKKSLTDVLNYHVSPGELTSDLLVNNPSIETLEGEDILVEVNDDTIEVNDATVIKPDVQYDGGWIQVIDAVLMP